MNTAIQEMVIHADQEISPLGGKFTETAQALVSHTLELRTVHELERLLERTDDKQLGSEESYQPMVGGAKRLHAEREIIWAGVL